MIANRHIEKIVSVMVAVAVVLCCVAMAFAGELEELVGGTGVSVDYRAKLFDTNAPITVNILMDEADWQDMLQTAASETYHKCNVEIAGKTFYEVGIRPKGNTSLSAIATNPDTDRYSFKLEFDQYIDDQTCFGLDKLILNNNYADATNMKEALIYDMYQFMGANASLYNYAEVHVNGEYWGVYLALESVEDSFLLRNFGASMGKLYKPDSMDMGDKGSMPDPENADPPSDDGFNPSSGDSAGGNGFNPSSGAPAGDSGFNPSSGDSAGDNGFNPSSGAPVGDNGSAPAADGQANPPEGGDPPSPGGFGGFSMGGNGANLNYIDDELDSYSDIWNGAVTKTKKSDRRRVVSALKNISEGTDLESSMDIDNLLRYMAVHVFSVNSDSLTGNMAHNYYLYEKNGRLNMIPWDYNLSLGGMGGGGDASGVINSPIDGAFTGTRFFDKLMENEEYLQGYHENLRTLVEQYIEGGGFDAFYTRTRAVLDELVKTDPTAFYSYEEYSDAAETLYQVVKLRGQSISGQLDGSIPSTQNGQRTGSANLVDTGNLDLSIMGTMNMDNGGMGGGGGFKGFGGGFNFGGFDLNGAKPDTDAASEGNADGAPSAAPTGNAPAQFNGTMPEGFDPAQAGSMPTAPTGGNAPAQFNETMPEGADASGFGASSGAPAKPQTADAQTGPNQTPAETVQTEPSQAPAEESTPAAEETTDPAAEETPAAQAQGPGGDFSGFNGRNSGTGSKNQQTKNLILWGISLAIIFIALIFAALYKRSSRKR